MTTTAPVDGTTARIGVIGGSGLYRLFEEGTADEIVVPTPYGETSSPITVGTMAGKRVAFLTRHGREHSVAPHLINHRANVWALRSLGVRAIVSSSAVGGLHPDYAPGTFVVTDQLIDRTWGRPDTFFEDQVQHLSFADPFDPVLRRAAVDAVAALDVPFRPTGTCVVIQGPRFSTRAESVWMREAGGHTINMTMTPEVPLAAELGIGTVNLSYVTDADAGLAPAEDDTAARTEAPVTHAAVMERLARANEVIVRAIGDVVAALPDDWTPRELVHGDVRDPVALEAALDGIDVVCHQAAKVGLGVDFQDAPDYVSSNDAGTAHVLAGMDRHGIGRLVVASSMVVYGEGAYATADGEPMRPPARRREDLDAGRFDPIGPDGRPLVPGLIDESAALDPRNVYAQTKVAQEHLASSWARATGGTAIALRYHNVYGPGMPSNTPYAGVASLFRSALARGEAPRVFEDGQQRRDFVHVDDVAGANAASIAATGELPAETFRAYNVGSGVVHTIGDMASAIAGPDGPQPVVTGEYRLGDVRHVTASSDRIRSELGWQAQVDFEQGMRDFATAPLRAAVQR